ncbi:MAG: hypothetical protein NTY77_14145 [Elusimicrobia bacterium]|nr:hypothetical protein [Elusimicrobiota bacterium]
MQLIWASILSLGLCGAVAVSAQPRSAAPAAVQFPNAARSGSWGFRPSFGPMEFQSLLQRFVDEQYLKSFRRLGIEDDFDHGHLLFDARSPQRPVAILYHTQELSSDSSLDPRARNWLQWVDRGTVEDASRYERKTYPHSASWDWFLQRELAALRQRHTILDKMLDPALLGVEVSQSRQWVFTRVGCGVADAAPGSDLIRVVLPAGPAVCLSLSQS